MAKPQPEDSHLRLAHSILEEIIGSDFSKRQISILLLILRLSWGCGKKVALIPKKRWFIVTGMHESAIKQELDYLSECKVISSNGTGYSFNKDFDQWRISRNKFYRKKYINSMIAYNISEGETDQPDLSDVIRHEETEEETTVETFKKGPPDRPLIDIDQKFSDFTRCYENNIAILNPHISDKLKECCDKYPFNWFEEACHIAVEQNIRRYKYIEAILERWSVDGKTSRKKTVSAIDDKDYSGWNE